MQRERKEVGRGAVGFLAFLFTVVFVLMLAYQSTRTAIIATGCLDGLLIVLYLGLTYASGGCGWCRPSDSAVLLTRRPQPDDVTLTRFDEEAVPAPSVTSAARPTRPPASRSPARPLPPPILSPADYEDGPPPDYKAVVAAVNEPPPSYSQVAAGYGQTVDLADEASFREGGEEPSAAPPEPSAPPQD